MAESEMDAQVNMNSEESEAKSSTRRPAKKRATKKTAKKPVKKTRAKKKDDEDETKTTSRPAKKRVSKKRVKKATKVEENDTGSGRKVISRRPDRKSPSSGAPAETATDVSASTAQNEAKAETAEVDSSMQWGRRAKKSAPIGWDDKSGTSEGARNKTRSAESAESKPAQPKEVAPAQVAEVKLPEPQQTPEAPAGASEQQTGQVAEPAETSTSESRREQTDQDNRRGRSRGGRNRGRRGRGRNDNSDRNDNDDSRNRNDNSDRNRNDDSRNRNDNSDRNRNDDSRNRNDNQRGQERDAQAPAQLIVEKSSLMELLATSWTEEKTREYLNDGILTRLSPGLMDGSGEIVKDTEAIKEPLKAIRRVLADECMVADDVADIMLLDVVMGALADRIEVCRLQANQQSLQDMNILMDMRCKADKRLIEAVNALKNA